MIEVPADIHYMFAQESLTKRLRVKWTISGSQVIDVTDRVLDIGEVTREVGPFLAGARVSNLSISLDNSDRFFSPHATGGVSMLAYRPGADYISGFITVEDGVLGPVTGFHYIPVYKGIVQTIDYTPGMCEVKIVDALSMALIRPIPEDFVLDPRLTPGEQIRTLITSFSNVPAGDIDTAGTFTRAEMIQTDLDWRVFGTIRANTTLDRAIADLARSGFGNVYADEYGKILYQTEFPKISGDQETVIRTYPELIASDNATSFAFTRGSGLIATEVVVGYQGVAAHYRDTTLESRLGRTTVPVAMPYTFLYRCARQAARVLYESAKDYMDTMTFVTHGIGLVMQVNDRVVIQDPINNVARTYRIVSKQWSDTFIGISAIFENHISTYIDETFGKMGTTSWTSSSARWW